MESGMGGVRYGTARHADRKADRWTGPATVVRLHRRRETAYKKCDARDELS